MFIKSLFTIVKTWKPPKCTLTDEWIKNMQCVYIYICVCIYIYIYIYNLYLYLYLDIHSAIKKSEVMPFAASWMNLEITILSEVSQKDKDKHHMISLTCGI